MTAQEIQASITMDIDARAYVVPMPAMNALVEASNSGDPMKVHSVLKAILTGGCDYITAQQGKLSGYGKALGMEI